MAVQTLFDDIDRQTTSLTWSYSRRNLLEQCLMRGIR